MVLQEGEHRKFTELPRLANYYPATMIPAPIEKNGGVLTIGYGSPDATTYAYMLPEGRDVDVGFIKIIFSTEILDPCSVVQSPYTQSSVRGVAQAGTQSMLTALENDAACIVGIITFCVVQRRLKAH